MTIYFTDPPVVKPAKRMPDLGSHIMFVEARFNTKRFLISCADNEPDLINVHLTTA